MRLATIEEDGWALRSGEEIHAENPTTFWMPSIEQRLAIQRGQAVKLLFDIVVEDDGRPIIQGERMWVIVAEQIGQVYLGILDNQPAAREGNKKLYLCFGAEIPFTSEHIIDIATPPSSYVEWQLSQPPERRWRRV